MSYSLIYYLVYFSIVFLLFPYFAFRKQQTNPAFQIFFGLLFIIIASMYFGFRGVQVGSDTGPYSKYYMMASNASSPIYYLKLHKYTDVFFYGVMYFCSKWMILPIFFSLISIGFFLSYMLFATTKYKEELLPLLISLLGLFFIFNLNTNIIRSAFALSLFFLFLFFREKRKFWCWLFLIASLLSHLTIIIPICTYFVAKNIKRTRLYYFIWLLTLLLATLHMSIQNIPFIQREIATSEKYSYLYNNSFDYHIGFRWDFTIFNFIFILLGFFAYRLKEKPYYFRMYLLLSAIFLLWYELPFSDRVGLYSWIFTPLILMDFARMNMFRRRNINYWILYILIVFLGIMSFVLIPKK